MPIRPSIWSFVLSLTALTALVALVACENGLTAADAPAPSPETMPRAAPLAPSSVPSETPAPPSPTPASSPADPVDPVDAADAGALADHVRHSLVVTTCAIDKSGCLLAQPSPPPEDSSYRVGHGGGVGTLRTRGQAMTDLYNEIRDRTGFGEHLAAESHHLGEPPPSLSESAARPRAGAVNDPLVEAAFQLMEMVDHEGEVTVDSAHARGLRDCKLSIGSLDSDAGGGARCMVIVPPSQHMGRSGRGH